MGYQRGTGGTRGVGGLLGGQPRVCHASHPPVSVSVTKISCAIFSMNLCPYKIHSLN